ncbi:PLP-dependent transferase [Mycena metata]|uniref:PLP-dependent transferase n=1 Tax=Mycena metata TaxID=1033252 RepID=A0AAD7KJ91_9AGAR|nr:PLP-dependent transferase [Mycena metata]
MDTALSRALSRVLSTRASKATPIIDLDKPHAPCSGDLFSNDYLSLTSNPGLKSHFLETLSKQTNVLGSTGSRWIAGNSEWHVALEQQMMRFFSAPAALLYSSGFTANLGILATLPQASDAIIFDERIHASCHAGMALSRTLPAARIQFTHNSIHSLRKCLVSVLDSCPQFRSGTSTIFVVVESVHSMDGDVAPLEEIIATIDELVPSQSAHLMVDESHATGVYGSAGRGLVSLLGLESKVHTRLHTFGKGIGSSGAVVLTTPLTRTYLINYSRSLIFTTSAPIFSLIATSCAFDVLEANGDRLIARLMHLCRFFADALALHLRPIPSAVMSLMPRTTPPISPIFPILVCAPLALETYLRREGYAATAMPHPVVPRGKERIRVCVHAGNTEDELLRFVRVLTLWAKNYTAETQDGRGTAMHKSHL